MYLSKDLPITVEDNIDSLKRKPDITDQDIAHMIQVYYAEYVLQSQWNTAPSLADISDIYRKSQNLLYSFRKLRVEQQKNALKTWHEMPNNDEINTIFRQTLPPEKMQLWDALFPIQYQIRMIGDVWSTMMIVSDIIRRKINPRIFDGHFMGIDLGTGSGILLAAQSILATRNDFESQELYGIDGNPTIVEMTEHFSKKMNWCILLWDTTDETVWDDIPDGDIACVTNENIPSHTGHMAREPFLENMDILWRIRGWSILSETVFFPSQLDIIKSPSFWAEVCYQWTPENKFCTLEIGEDERCFAAAWFGNLKESLIPHMITLDGTHMSIEDIHAQWAKRLGKKIGVRRFLSRF